VKHSVRRDSWSRKATRRCGTRIDIYFNNKNKNFIAYWKGKLLLEFLTGERPNLDKLHRHITFIRGGGRIQEAFDKAKATVEYNKRKYKEHMEDVKKDVRKAIADHVDGGDVAMQLKDGTIIEHTGSKKRSFVIERG